MKRTGHLEGLICHSMSPHRAFNGNLLFLNMENLVTSFHYPPSFLSFYQYLSVVCEPWTAPKMGLDPKELQVLPVRCALHQDLWTRIFPRWANQVSQLVFMDSIKHKCGIYSSFSNCILWHCTVELVTYHTGDTSTAMWFTLNRQFDKYLKCVWVVDFRDIRDIWE